LNDWNQNNTDHSRMLPDQSRNDLSICRGTRLAQRRFLCESLRRNPFKHIVPVAHWFEAFAILWKNWTPLPHQAKIANRLLKEESSARFWNFYGSWWAWEYLTFKPFWLPPSQAVNFKRIKNRNLPWVSALVGSHVIFGRTKHWTCIQEKSDRLVWGLEVPPRYGKYRDCTSSMEEKSPWKAGRSDYWHRQTLESMAANCLSKALTIEELNDTVKLTTCKIPSREEARFSKKTANRKMEKLPLSSQVRGKITWKNLNGKISPWRFSTTWNRRYQGSGKSTLNQKKCFTRL